MARRALDYLSPRGGRGPSAPVDPSALAASTLVPDYDVSSAAPTGLPMRRTATTPATHEGADARSCRGLEAHEGLGDARDDIPRSSITPRRSSNLPLARSTASILPGSNAYFIQSRRLGSTQAPMTCPGASFTDPGSNGRSLSTNSSKDEARAISSSVSWSQNTTCQPPLSHSAK